MDKKKFYKSLGITFLVLMCVYFVFTCMAIKNDYTVWQFTHGLWSTLISWLGMFLCVKQYNKN